jgi:hypothetical protein
MARLREVERAYFVRKAGGAEPTEPLNNLKRRYMAETIGGGTSPQTPMHELEKLWLLAVIGGAGDFQSNADLWKLAVSSLGETPSAYENDNKIKFYVNAP